MPDVDSRAGGIEVPALPSNPRALAADLLDELIRLGRDNAAGRWSVRGDLADARNMHATNRMGELRAALTGDYDWLEVDVRRIDGRLVASHDRMPARDALRMEDWIRIGAATERGLKLDFKERAAVAPTLDLVTRAGIAHERLVINVPVRGDERLSLDQLRRIRRRFPRATINLSLGSGAYTARVIATAVALGRGVGGPVAFPLDLARVDDRIVRAFTAGGHVAIWNDPRRTPVRDRDATREQLRSWGVDGTIDLR
jgi:hypothetical protein